jgi:hypothetical protein
MHMIVVSWRTVPDVPLVRSGRTDCFRHPPGGQTLDVNVQER